MTILASLADVRTLLIDMDGVVYHGDATLPGVDAFLSFLRQHQIRFAFATNGTNKWPRDHYAVLAAHGIDAQDATIYTAGLAAAAYLASQGPGLRAFVIGGEGFRRQVVERGHCILESENPDVVVVGWTPDFDYHQLETACLAIYRGARLILADPDVNDPSPIGPLPGSGAFAAAIEAATGAKSLAIGKPNRLIFETALEGLGASSDTAAMLGDRLDSDIKGGLAMAMGTILVLTGLTTPGMLEQSDIQPRWVAQDLHDLRRQWEQALHTGG